MGLTRYRVLRIYCIGARSIGGSRGLGFKIWQGLGFAGLGQGLGFAGLGPVLEGSGLRF